ncbi:MAG: DUF4243 domain-containing protein [Gammaproteobacteria bacterium]|nr:DUF4243 domain-containing protein [Gammaproteobacteria bacterium]
MISNVCVELIVKSAHYPVVYSRRLFNHLPMTLVALDEMGATKIQLKSSQQHYVQRFSITSSDDDRNPIEQQFKNFQQLYLESLTEIGIDKTLAKTLPTLMPGVAAGSFYCMTRLASALKTKNLSEIAFALACWRVYYLDVGGIKGAVNKKPGSLLRTITKATSHYRFPAGNTVDRIANILAIPAYHEQKSQLQEINFDIVAIAVVSAYQMTGHFTLLQAIVAIKALGELLPYIDDKELALRYFWQALVLVYLSTGCVLMNANESVDLIPWQDIRSFCCDSPNEHLIELCCACEELTRITGNLNFHKVASRQVHFNR